MATKYPNEIASIRKKQTFYVESFLSPMNEASDKDNYFPLMTHGHYSRYSACIINEDKKAAAANIPVQEMKQVLRISDYALHKHFDAVYFGNKEKISPAYTVQFTAGNLKGKTPAQVLIEDPKNGGATLNGQYEFLKQNLEKYKRNQILMDAIRDAADLLKSGKLNAETAMQSSGTAIKLYEAKSRINPYKPRQDGMCPVRDMLITWSIGGSDNPITVSIKNYYAPYHKLQNGLNVAEPDKMDKTTYVDNTMNLSVEEWCEVVNNIRMNLNQFELLQASNMFAEAARLDKENRANARSASGTVRQEPVYSNTQRQPISQSYGTERNGYIYPSYDQDDYDPMASGYPVEE